MRTVSFSLGLLLMAGTVWCGYYAGKEQSFVAWFGVITAIISPLAFELVLFPFRARDKELIRELSKVPKIEQLLKEAKDNEEKVKLLESQRKELDKLIAYEAKKRTLEAERQIYIQQGQEALKALSRVNEKLDLLTDEKNNLPEVLRPLLDNTDNEKEVIKYVVNNVSYILRKSSFGIFPFYGPLLFDILKNIKQLFDTIDTEDD